jgi:hypothetical protein
MSSKVSQWVSMTKAARWIRLAWSGSTGFVGVGFGVGASVGAGVGFCVGAGLGVAVGVGEEETVVVSVVAAEVVSAADVTVVMSGVDSVLAAAVIDGVTIGVGPGRPQAAKSSEQALRIAKNTRPARCRLVLFMVVTPSSAQRELIRVLCRKPPYHDSG